LKILLLSPGGTFFSKRRDFFKYVENSREMQTILHYWNGIGAALPTISGATPVDDELRIIDENLEKINFDEHSDLVGITAITQQANRAYEIADEFRKRGRYVVMGGIHATVLPEEAMEHVNSVFVGEGENTWPAFIRDFKNGSPQKIYRQTDFAPVNLQLSPIPRYDLIERYSYPVVWLFASRGCPHDCEFCAASKIYGKKWKHKSTVQVSREIEEVKKRWKFAQIGFADDNLFQNKSFSYELVERFSDLSFTWYAQSDLSVARDVNFLRKLRKGGCRILFIGFESTNPKNLASINANHWKATQYREYRNSIARIQENGIGIYGSFIVGLDYDDSTVFQNTIRFINENNLLGAQITILTPLPGSRLRVRLEKENRILSNDWQLYTGWNALIRHRNLSPETLERGLLEIYQNVYNRDNYRKRANYFRGICHNLIN